MIKRSSTCITAMFATVVLSLSACGGSSNSSSNSSTITYPLVSVGNPGNESDPATDFGSVAYPYQIGKYDVTIGQYTIFLNAVAKTDTYELYNPNMGTDLNSAGITRTGSSGNYVYSVMMNGGSSANRPITYVTWLDAARFANWMANGQPTGIQNSTTTENGAYNLNGAMDGNAVVKNLINPNTGESPTYYIPSYNEWYKAAFYSPKKNSGAGGYYLYATESDTAPGNTVGSAPNQANYFLSTLFSVTQSPDYLYAAQNYLTDVGAFSGSASYYGTFDQDGNVYQWNDLDGAPVPYRGLAGGYWFSASSTLQPLTYNTNAINATDNGTGFRLAAPAAIN